MILGQDCFSLLCYMFLPISLGFPLLISTYRALVGTSGMVDLLDSGVLPSRVTYCGVYTSGV